MATKGSVRFFKKVLPRGLTGLEAGKLMLREGLGRRKGQSILTDREVDAIKERVKDGKDLRDYNGIVDVGIAIDNLVLLAQNNALETCRRLSLADDILIDWFDEGRFKVILSDRPRIVTVKQFQDLKAEQKKKVLSDLYSLDQVTSWRALELAPDGIRAKAGDPDTLKEQQPDLYRQLCQQARGQIRKLMRSGKLEATYFEGDFKKEKKAIQELENKLLEQNLTEEEWSVLLQEKVYFTGETLYRSGLPEWPRWIDGQEHSYDEKTESNYRVAILQATSPDEVDELGYYKEEHRLPYMPRMVTERFKDTAGELFKQMLGTVREGLRHFRALETVIEDATEALRVNFSEDIQYCRGNLSAHLKRFNGHLDAIKNLDPHLIAKLLSASTVKLDPREIEPIDLDQAFPDPKTLKGARDNIATVGLGVMGEGWWIRIANRADDEEDSSDES